MSDDLYMLLVTRGYAQHEAHRIAYGPPYLDGSSPEPSARYRFPRQPKLEDGWTIEYAYLDKVLQECRKGVDNWVSYPEQVESVLMALERLSATKEAKP